MHLIWVFVENWVNVYIMLREYLTHKYLMSAIIIIIVFVIIITGFHYFNVCGEHIYTNSGIVKRDNKENGGKNPSMSGINVNIFVWFNHCNDQHSSFSYYSKENFKVHTPNEYPHTFNTCFHVQSVSEDRAEMKYKLWLFSLATAAELNTVSDPVLVDNYFLELSKRQCINWGQVPTLVKANSMALTTFLWFGGSKEEIIKDPKRHQVSRSPHERAITPLPHGKITPVWLAQFFCNYKISLGWMAGDENTKRYIGVDKDNNHDN